MFMTNLSIISRYSRTFLERRLKEYNIGFSEQLIMLYLCKCDIVNQDTIAKHFMLDKGAVAKALNKLEKKEFIVRTDNPRNKREKLISITVKGKSVTGYMSVELEEWHKYLFKGLSKEDIDLFNKIVDKMSENAANIINEKKDIYHGMEKSL